MSKGFIYGLAVGLVVVAAAGAGASRRYQRDAPKETSRRAELAQYEKEIVDATPVQLGVLTDKQRIHSRFYTYYQQVRGGRSISDLAAKAKGKSKIVETMVLPGLGPLLTEPETRKSFFAKLTNQSDAVIRGRVVNKVSQITEDGSFIFTDYDIIIAEVFKNNITTPIETGATITITRPGGKVIVDDVIVKAKDASFAPLPLNSDVLLFLKFIPATGSYRVTEATGSFEFDGSSLHPLTERAFPPGVLEDKGSLFKTLRDVSKQH